MLFSSWQRYGKGFASPAGRRTVIVLGAAFILTMGIGSVRADTFTAGSAGALISAINSANKVGGSHTIILAPDRTFDVKSGDNTTDGANGLPVIGGDRAVDLTIIGNGATIRRIQTFNRYNQATNTFRLFNVNRAASLTLEDVTLEGGWAYGLGVAGYGGAICNQGTLTVNSSSFFLNNAVNGGVIYNAGGTVTLSDCQFLGGQVEFRKGKTNIILSSNNAGKNGGAIYNDAGTLTIGDSTLFESSAFSGGGIYNSGGTVAVINSALFDNAARFGGGIYNAGGMVTVSGSMLFGNLAFHFSYSSPTGGGDGGGIYNDVGGIVVVENASDITGNTADLLGADVYNLGVLYLHWTSTIGILDGHPPILF